MGGTDNVKFSSDGTWGKGVITGGADTYLVIVADGGDVWKVNIVPQKALSEGLFAQLTGYTGLTFTEAYADMPEGTTL